jgi:cell division protein FtsQ
MTMLDRRARGKGDVDAEQSQRPVKVGRRAGRKAKREAKREARRQDKRARTTPPPASAGPDEETVRLASKDFRRRRNAGRWRRVRLVVAALLALALVGGAVWLVYFSSYVTVRETSVSGNDTVKPDRIRYTADVPTGAPLARVDLDAIRARVESIPAVRRAEVSRSWPHTVQVTVTERTPVAVVDQGAGLRAMDADGVLFGGYAERPRDLPLVRTAPDVEGEALEEGALVVDSLPQRVASRVDVVQVSSVDEIELVLGSGRRVLWGSAEDSDQKAEVLAVLMKRPGNQIDVSVPGRPTTR